MKNLNLVGQFDLAKMAKFGVASAFLGVSLFALSGCGDSGEFKPSDDEEKKDFALVKEKYSDAKFLSYKAAKKELGSTSSRDFKECLKGNTYFAKLPNGEIKISKVYILDDNSLSVKEIELKDLKFKKAECFSD